MASPQIHKIKQGDITELKSLSAPPRLVKETMDAVCLLLGKQTGWQAAKKLMADSNFFNLLNTYDIDNIPTDALKKIRDGYLQDPQSSYESVQKVSTAAASICRWVHEINEYEKQKKGTE